MNEEFKFKVIKKLVDSKGNKNSAAIKLNCSRHTVDRLVSKYTIEGKAGFLHKNRGRRPSTTIEDEIKRTVIDLYRTKYYNANFKHFSELLAKYEDIVVSDSSLNTWLTYEDILSPKAR